jgi:hypothetical protein
MKRVDPYNDYYYGRHSSVVRFPRYGCISPNNQSSLHGVSDNDFSGAMCSVLIVNIMCDYSTQCCYTALNGAHTLTPIIASLSTKLPGRICAM